MNAITSLQIDRGSKSLYEKKRLRAKTPRTQREKNFFRVLGFREPQPSLHTQNDSQVESKRSFSGEENLKCPYDLGAFASLREMKFSFQQDKLAKSPSELLAVAFASGSVDQSCPVDVGRKNDWPAMARASREKLA